MAKEQVPATGLPVGLNRGFIVTKREVKPRIVDKKGRATPRVKLIREVIREVCGFAPYERRIMELLKIGNASTNKRALKLAKRRLGTHRRGVAKREEMQEVIIQQRRRAAAAHAHH